MNDWQGHHYIIAGLFALLAILVGFVAWSNWEDQQGCMYFQNRNIEHIPARCISYFGGLRR